MNENPLFEACFDLASKILVKKDTITIDQIEENLETLTNEANKFHRMAIEHQLRLTDFEDHENIVVRAVDYINYVYAIPPLRGTYSWFDEMLRALLELSCPTIILDKERMSFLDDIEKGIKIARNETLNN